MSDKKAKNFILLANILKNVSGIISFIMRVADEHEKLTFLDWFQAAQDVKDLILDFLIIFGAQHSFLQLLLNIKDGLLKVFQSNSRNTKDSGCEGLRYVVAVTIRLIGAFVRIGISGYEIYEISLRSRKLLKEFKKDELTEIVLATLSEFLELTKGMKQLFNIIRKNKITQPDKITVFDFDAKQ